MSGLVHALRLHRRHPLFALVAATLLALAIGSATAVFSLVRAVLLRELPFADPDRLVWMYNARTERDRAPISIADLEDYRRESRALAGVAPFTNWTANLTGAGAAERIEGTRVGGDFFALLGARAAIGRTLDDGDAQAASRVVVLTHGLWTRRFGGDPAIVGSTIILNGAAYLVVGVLSPDFLFPFRDAEVAVPLSLRDDPRRADRGANFLRVVARLNANTTIAQAKSDLDAIAHRLQRQYPADDARKTGVSLYPLHAEIVSDYRQILWTLLGAVAVLIAVGCGNLGNLLLLRALARSSEIGVRVSLGASRGAIVRQLALEAAVLVVAGTALGLVVAQAAIAAWQTHAPTGFPRLDLVEVDGFVVAFAVVVCVAVVAICGILPAALAVRRLSDTVRGGGRTSSVSRHDGRVRRAFVVVQLAGTAVLLVCMTLVARALVNLERVDPGFTPQHAVAMQLSLPPARYATPNSIDDLYEKLQLALRGIGGVRVAGAVSLMPLSGLLSAIDLSFPGRPAPPPTEVPQAHFRIASAGYFSAAGIAVLDGREFDDRDNRRGAPAAIVSRAFAERHWPGERAVGQAVQISLGPRPTTLEIVGVVGDVKQFGVDGTATADLYIALAQIPPSQVAPVAARMYWIVRTEGPPSGLVEPIRAAVHAVDPDVAASSVRPLDEILAASLGGRRASVRLLEVFGQAAIVLVVLGVYCAAAFAANGRRHEMAVRSAFGAQNRDLVTLVVGSETMPMLGGIALGLAIAWPVARTLGPLLFGVSAADPSTYAAVALVLTTVGVLASWVPAMRATRVDPAELLRS